MSSVGPAGDDQVCKLGRERSRMTIEELGKPLSREDGVSSAYCTGVQRDLFQACRHEDGR